MWPAPCSWRTSTCRIGVCVEGGGAHVHRYTAPPWGCARGPRPLSRPRMTASAPVISTPSYAEAVRAGPLLRCPVGLRWQPWSLPRGRGRGGRAHGLGDGGGDLACGRAAAQVVGCAGAVVERRGGRASPAAALPRSSSSIAAESTAAAGLAVPVPAMSGAAPGIRLEDAGAAVGQRARGREADGRRRAEVVEHVANMFSVTTTS